MSERTKITTTIKKNLLQAARHYAVHTDKALNEIIEDALAAYIPEKWKEAVEKLESLGKPSKK